MQPLALWAVLVTALPTHAQDASPDPVDVAEDTDTDAGLDTDAPPAPDPAIEALRAELEAMRGQLDAQQERLDKAEQQLTSQRKTLAETKLEVKKKPDLRFDINGYYRLRGHIFGAKLGKSKPVTGGLYNEQPTSGKFMNQRLRLQLTADYKEGLAKLHVGVQALDNVIWGDNSGITRTSLFASDPGNTRRDLSEAPPFQLFRAWTEVRLPIGQLRAGRMSSHWGMGLLANDGDGFDDDFGENYYGNQFDRVLFATNPVSIVQAITKKDEQKEIPLILAVGVDRLVEDPLVQYYGYRCSRDVADSSPDYDPRCDANGDGLTDIEHGNTADRTSTSRGINWWADSRDDVWEMLYVLVYRGKRIKMFKTYSDLTAGAYVIQRVQKETDSNVVIGDIYLDWKINGAFLAFEGLGIWGRTNALDLPAFNEDNDPDFNPLEKKAAIYGYVARAGYENDRFRVLFESGYASGDDDPTDQKFTGRPLHPDHNVGLLLYEEVIDQVTRSSWTGDASALASSGGVYNSHYIFPRASVVPFNNWQILAGFLVAFPDRPDGAVFRCNDADAEKYGCTSAGDDIADILGWEVDLAVKHRWYDHLLFSLEMGYAKATNRMNLERAGLSPTGNFWTLQSRLAWEF